MGSRARDTFPSPGMCYLHYPFVPPSSESSDRPPSQGLLHCTALGSLVPASLHRTFAFPAPYSWIRGPALHPTVSPRTGCSPGARRVSFSLPSGLCFICSLICPTPHSFARQTFTETEMSRLSPWCWKFKDESSLDLVLRGQRKPDKETALVTQQDRGSDGGGPGTAAERVGVGGSQPGGSGKEPWRRLCWSLER